jgi:NAD(P)-dependent dehydrogenase (short-subunit alcohol dehydrogenase family)
LDVLARATPDRVHVVEFDVTDEASIQKALSDVEMALGGKDLDVLIDNAGVRHWADDGTKST